MTLITKTYAASLCETTLLSIQENSNRILAARKNGTLEETINPWPEPLRSRGIEPRHPEIIEVRGIPDFVRALDAKTEEPQVFRHFVQSPEAWDTIQKTLELKAGPRVFELAAPGAWIKRYLDLGGVFLTAPDAWPETVGLGAFQSIPYIDVVVDNQVPILELNATTQVYLIPSGPNAVPITIVNSGILRLF